MGNIAGMIINYILIILIIGGIGYAIYYFVKKLSIEDDSEYENIYTEEYLRQAVSEAIALQLKQNFKEMNLSRRELELQNKERAELRNALKEAAYGNRTAKNIVKSLIKDIISSENGAGIDSTTINNVIKFNDPSNLRPRDKFLICAYVYNKKYGLEGITKMIETNNLNAPKYREDGNVYYEISPKDISKVHKKVMGKYTLTYEDKLEILTQRIFEKYKGLGPVDILFDSLIDEIDSGVSGKPKDFYEIRRAVENDTNLDTQEYSYMSSWIMFHGINIRMSCIPYDSQDELIRVCQNIYKYNTPEALSKRNGGVVSTMKDGSRIVVVRPPLSDSWAFFARKFDSTPSLAPDQLFTDPGNDIVIFFIWALIRGRCNCIISGQQGTGKTTTLKSVLRFVEEFLTIRIQEKAFEMNLRYEYPLRNIVTFQETETISMQEGINLSKKTNGSLSVFGEIASDEGAGEYLQTCRVASYFGIGTHHGKTPEALIKAFTIPGETQESVSQTINFDIHMEKAGSRRFCQRITEIIPITDRRYPSEINPSGDRDKDLQTDTFEYHKRMTDRQIFEARDIVVYKDGAYHFVNMPSQERIEAMLMNMRDEDKAKFQEGLKNMRRTG